MITFGFCFLYLSSLGFSLLSPNPGLIVSDISATDECTNLKARFLSVSHELEVLIDSKIPQAETQLDRLATKQKNVSEEIGVSIKSIDDANLKIKSLNDTLIQEETNYQNLMTETTRKREAEASVFRLLTKNDHQIRTTEEEMREVESLIRSQEGQQTQLTLDVKMARNDQRAAVNDKRLKQKTFDRRRTDLLHTEQNLAENNVHIKEAESSLKTTKNNIKKREEEIVNIKQTLQKLNVESEDYKNELRISQEATKMRKYEIKRLNSELSIKKMRLENLRVSVKSQEEKMKEGRKRVEEETGRINAMQSSQDILKNNSRNIIEENKRMKNSNDNLNLNLNLTTQLNVNDDKKKLVEDLEVLNFKSSQSIQYSGSNNKKMRDSLLENKNKNKVINNKDTSKIIPTSLPKNTIDRHSDGPLISVNSSSLLPTLKSDKIIHNINEVNKSNETDYNNNNNNNNNTKIKIQTENKENNKSIPDPDPMESILKNSELFSLSAEIAMRSGKLHNLRLELTDAESEFIESSQEFNKQKKVVEATEEMLKRLETYKKINSDGNGQGGSESGESLRGITKHNNNNNNNNNKETPLQLNTSNNTDSSNNTLSELEESIKDKEAKLLAIESSIKGYEDSLEIFHTQEVKEKETRKSLEKKISDLIYEEGKHKNKLEYLNKTMNKLIKEIKEDSNPRFIDIIKEDEKTIFNGKDNEKKLRNKGRDFTNSLEVLKEANHLQKLNHAKLRALIRDSESRLHESISHIKHTEEQIQTKSKEVFITKSKVSELGISGLQLMKDSSEEENKLTKLDEKIDKLKKELPMLKTRLYELKCRD